jgi:hypothetical protein
MGCWTAVVAAKSVGGRVQGVGVFVMVCMVVPLACRSEPGNQYDEDDVGRKGLQVPPSMLEI